MDERNQNRDPNVPETPDAPHMSDITPPDVVDSRVINDAEPVPSRLQTPVEGAPDRLSAGGGADDDLVAEYEDRYYGARRLEASDPEGPHRQQRPPAAPPRIQPRRAKAKRTMAAVDENERKWASLAHGSTLLTALAALFSGGLLVLVTMFVPLLIYFSFRKRSEYVAFHALQAFTVQLLGTVGWMVLVLVGTLVSVALMIVAAILIIVLIGIVLLPLVIVTYILFLLASLALPLGMVIYSVIAMTETWGGHDYRIPYVGRWVENQMVSDSPLSL